MGIEIAAHMAYAQRLSAQTIWHLRLKLNAMLHTFGQAITPHTHTLSLVHVPKNIVINI